MGIFDKLFGASGDRGKGSERSTSHSPVAKPAFKTSEKPPVKYGRLPNELSLARRKTPEGNEGVKKILAPQLRIGKTVMSQNGPLRGRSEHHLTGAPRGVSMTTLDQISRMLPIENIEERDPLSNAWAKEGGSVMRFTRVIDGVPYVVYACIAMRNEAGYKPDGITHAEGSHHRMYTEKRMMFVPQGEDSIALIPGLEKLMMLAKSDPHVGKDSDGGKEELDPLTFSTEILDEPLPEGWFDDSVKEMIIRIASGEPFSIQDWTSQKDFLKRVFYALLCLPEQVAREVSFGSGSFTATGKVRFEQTMGSLTNVRKIGDTWKNGDPERVRFGEQYLAQVVAKERAGMTPRDMMKAVNALPDDLTQKVEAHILGEERKG